MYESKRRKKEIEKEMGGKKGKEKERMKMDSWERGKKREKFPSHYSYDVRRTVEVL